MTDIQTATMLRIGAAVLLLGIFFGFFIVHGLEMRHRREKVLLREESKHEMFRHIDAADRAIWQGPDEPTRFRAALDPVPLTPDLRKHFLGNSFIRHRSQTTRLLLSGSLPENSLGILFQAAASGSSIEGVHRMLNLGAPFDYAYVSDQGQRCTLNVLHSALQDTSGSVAETKACLRLLIAAGAPVDAKAVGKLNLTGIAARIDGITPLMVAAANGRQEAIPILLKAGADVRLRAANKMTAADMAEYSGHLKIAAVLDRWTKANYAIPIPARKTSHRPMWVYATR